MSSLPSIQSTQVALPRWNVVRGLFHVAIAHILIVNAIWIHSRVCSPENPIPDFKKNELENIEGKGKNRRDPCKISSGLCTARPGA